MTVPNASEESSGSEIKTGMDSELKKRIVSAIIMIFVTLLTAYWGNKPVAGIQWLQPFTIFWGIVSFIAFYECLAMIGCRQLWQILICGCIIIMFPIYLFLATSSVPEGVMFIEDAINEMQKPMAFLMPASILVAAFSGILTYIAFKETRKTRFWMMIGLIYAMLLVVSISYIRNAVNAGGIYIIWLFATVWVTDIAAFFTGRHFGGPKLCPRVSPKKTWSGFLGGLLFGTLAGILIFQISSIFGRYPSSYFAYHFKFIIFYSLLGSFLCQIGDLLESAVKRYFSVKDSSKLIPGHGGVLDRVDGLWATSLFFAIILFKNG